ncbi:MAG: PAS domain-containing protein, partial [Beijerinckiaceae bacterium]
MPAPTMISATMSEDDYPGLGRYVWRVADGRLGWSPGLVRLYGRQEPPRSEAEFMACLHPDDRIRVEGETEAFLTGDADSYSHSFRIIRPNGEVRYVIDRARINRDAVGRVTEIHGVNMDITDFPHLAQASMDAESGSAVKAAPRGFLDHEKLEVGQSTSGLVLADIDYRAGTFLLSAAAARLYGLGDTAMTVPREAVHATFHPDDREVLAANILASIDPVTGGRLVTEHRILLPDGGVRWLQVQKRIDFSLTDGRRHPDRGILAAVDITERKLAETRLRESDERLATAQEVAGIGVWDVSLKDGRAVWSPGLYKLLQVDPAIPASADLFFEMMDPDDLVRVRRELEIAVQENSQFKSEFGMVLKNGEVRHFIGQGRVTENENGRPIRMVGINYDITERKLAELKLRENEARLRMILDETVALVGIVDLDGTLREANRVALEAGGLQRADVIGRPFWEASWWNHDPAEVLRLKQAIADAAKGHHVRYDATIKAADGLRTIDFSLSPVLNDAGQVVLLVPSALDVTERKSSERRLAASEARYRALFDSINAGFCVVEVSLDASGGRTDYRVVEANPAFYDRTGFPKAIFNRWLRQAAPDLEEHWYEIYGGVARTGEPRRFEEYSAMLGRWFDVYAFPIDSPQECRVAILFHDITESKRNQAHVDLLLKEVNHRAKNMLSLVNVIAKRSLSNGADGFMERFSARISALAANQDILVRSEWKTVDQIDLVRGQLAHFEDLFDSRIHVDGSPILLFPEAAEKLGMALHELTTNAGKYGALSNNSGQIKISWRVDQRGDEQTYVLEWRETGGPLVKPPHQTGFGSLVSGSLLASGLGGTVDADYHPSGLVWRLVCPLASVTAVDDTASVPDEAAAEQSQGAGVLVVDDDPILALSIADILKDAGLTVIGPTGNASIALALVARTRPSFAILDVNLGKETSEPVALELRR